MRNRAKCKKCGDVIESYHASDLVMCKCGEIEVDGGEAMKCAARDFVNFVRVDDKGNEIVVKVVGKEVSNAHQLVKDNASLPTREELITMLEDLVKGIDNLPEAAMNTYVTHADLWNALTLVLHIIKR